MICKRVALQACTYKMTVVLSIFPVFYKSTDNSHQNRLMPLSPFLLYQNRFLLNSQLKLKLILLIRHPNDELIIGPFRIGKQSAYIMTCISVSNVIGWCLNFETGISRRQSSTDDFSPVTRPSFKMVDLSNLGTCMRYSLPQTWCPVKGLRSQVETANTLVAEVDNSVYIWTVNVGGNNKCFQNHLCGECLISGDHGKVFYT